MIGVSGPPPGSQRAVSRPVLEAKIAAWVSMRCEHGPGSAFDQRWGIRRLRRRVDCCAQCNRDNRCATRRLLPKTGLCAESVDCSAYGRSSTYITTSKRTSNEITNRKPRCNCKMELHLNTHIVCKIGAHAKTMCQQTHCPRDCKVSAADGSAAAYTLPLTIACHQISTPSHFNFLSSRGFLWRSMTQLTGSRT